MRRIVCITLPQLRVELARLAQEDDDARSREVAEESAERARAGSEGEPRGARAPGRDGSRAPLAVVVAVRGGAVKSDRDVLGGTRLDVVSREARALGVRTRQTVASARARSAGLRVRVVSEETIRSAIERVAEAASAFGPLVAIDVQSSGRASDRANVGARACVGVGEADLVWVDISGCAHLHGGERELARSLAARVEGLGHACRVAIADGPRIAAAVARFAPVRGRSETEPLVVPPGKGAAAMRVLPVAALALGDATNEWLSDLGLPTCGHLQELPRRSLGVRLGDRACDVDQLLGGDDPAPLVAWRPPPVPEERVELEWGASSVEALGFVVKRLCERMAVRLEGRGVGTTRVELVLALDRALCEGAASVSTIDVALPVPVRLAADLFTVVRTRLERHALPAPVLVVTLRAPGLTPSPAQPLDLLEPEPHAVRALPRLVAELAVDVGHHRVGTLGLVDTWRPDERTCVVPFGASRARPRHAQVTSALEPTRLVEPAFVAGACLRGARALLRVEVVEWWRESPADRTRPTRPTRESGGARTPRASRDYVAAWVDADGAGRSRAAGRAEAWIELQPSGEPGDGGRLRGWLD